MNDDLTPDPELERRLDAARDNLTSRRPRPDARIVGLLGAGPTTVVNLTYVSNAPSLSSEEALFAAAKRGRMACAH